jgi:hypothetical protein
MDQPQYDNSDRCEEIVSGTKNYWPWVVLSILVVVGVCAVVFFKDEKKTAQKDENEKK